MNRPLSLLNQLTPEIFLAEYWQKKPLLIRQAIPNFTGLLSPNELAGLACEDDVQSRIIQNKNNTWTLTHGPFSEDTFSTLPESNWTLLVQSVNHHLPEAATLLKQFNFIPHARLDDLMVSYAPKGGSVGAHLDSYDVFLLQANGSRRWKINTHPDLSLIEDASIRLLKQFETEQEWVLAPGDMLYLPPNIAHHGISEDDNCMTYSIGFRAPKKQALIEGFLAHLQETIQVDGLYEDADLRLQRHPSEISDAMIAKVEHVFNSITWHTKTVSDFLGRSISEPPADVVFESPFEDIDFSIDDFAQALTKQNMRLDLKSQLLFSHDCFYLNGEQLIVTPSIAERVRELADHRILQTINLTEKQRSLLASNFHVALMAGYVHLE
ncbi:MAG: cupin domain-containing protein [Methylophilaceae bacterium]|nr:cupin domain-containing protein [Methylophilaceae bacterium]